MARFEVATSFWALAGTANSRAIRSAERQDRERQDLDPDVPIGSTVFAIIA
jgi:hypothetical protein